MFTWLPLFPSFTSHLFKGGVSGGELDNESSSVQVSAVHQALEGGFSVTQSVELHEGESPEKTK